MSRAVTDGHALEDRLDRFRALRRELEASVLPLATSVDGRRFSFQASLHELELEVGGYVVLGEGRLGQVLAIEMALREGTDLDLPPDEQSGFGLRTEVPIRHARGEGTVLEGDGAPFHDDLVRRAAPEEVRGWLERTQPRRAQLPIGELAAAPGVAFALDAGGFDRHTFLCGQSGSGKTYSLGVILEALAASGRPEARRLVLRARNLGADAFGVWSRGTPGSLLDALTEQGPRCAVIDLGSLPTREEQGLVAAFVLGELWRRRERREPVLIVIDEAHNVCPARPDDPLVALATEYAVRIAAEGRKFGIYLLVSTQRPQKVHENVISQCDNLVLMRLNSAADAAFAQSVFSFVPAGLVDRATTFRLGEALVAGKVSPKPCADPLRRAARRRGRRRRPDHLGPEEVMSRSRKTQPLRRRARPRPAVGITRCK